MKLKATFGLAATLLLTVSGCSAATNETATSDKTACDGVYAAWDQFETAHAEWLGAWATDSPDSIALAIDLMDESSAFRKSAEKILPDASSELQAAVTEIMDSTDFLVGEALLSKNDSVATENMQNGVDSLNKICEAAGSAPLK